MQFIFPGLNWANAGRQNLHINWHNQGKKKKKSYKRDTGSECISWTHTDVASIQSASIRLTLARLEPAQILSWRLRLEHRHRRMGASFEKTSRSWHHCLQGELLSHADKRPRPCLAPQPGRSREQRGQQREGGEGGGGGRQQMST